MEKSSIDQPEKCSKCGNFPEDILMLACSHDLCLLCAAKVFQKSDSRYSRNSNSLICDICGVSTHLDQSSIYELEKIAIASNLSINGSNNERTIIERNTNNNIERNTISRTPTRQREPEKTRNQINSIDNKEKERSKIEKPTYNINPIEKNTYNMNQIPNSAENTNRSYSAQFMKGVKGFCPEHPEEEISYFCFNCLANCICPECIIHGIHKNHEVMTIRKAFPLIKAKIDDFSKQLNNKIDDYKSGQENLRTKKRDHFDQNKLIKKAITDFFGDLKNKIELKEKEIIKTADQFLEANIKEIDQEITQIESNITQLFSEVDNLNSHLSSKEESILLNFYASHVKNVEKNIFSNETTVQKLNEPNFLDVKDLQQQINNLAEQVVCLNTLALPDSNKLMQSMSKSASQMFNNIKFSPLPSKQNDENLFFEYDRKDKNLRNLIPMNPETKPPKAGLSQQNIGKNIQGNTKVLKPYNV